MHCSNLVRFFYTLILIGTVPCVSLALDIDNPPAGVFQEEWYVIMLDGKKAGHSHITMERGKEDGDEIIRTASTTHIEVGRGGQVIAMTMTKNSKETLDGHPLAFIEGMQMGKMPALMHHEGTIRDGKVTVQTRQFGSQGQTQTYPYPEGALLSWGTYRETIKKGLEPGTEYTLQIYEPSTSLRRPLKAEVKVGEKEMIDLFGRKVEAIRTIQTATMRNMFGQETTVDSVTWMTRQGDPVLVEMAVMDIPIKMMACTKAVALAPNEPTELMASTFITPSQPLKPSAKRVTYRMTVTKKGAELPQLPETTIQKVEQIAKNKSQARIVVERIDAALASARKEKLPEEQRKRCLEASVMMDHKDPVVAKLAQEAGKDEKDPMKLAENLTRFVSRFVQSKDLGVGFASASEVARSREGDCSEHGVLLATLGRAHGIPARAVTGLVYADQFAGSRNIFAGHLWTQFWIDGRWVDFDATRPDVPVGPDHIALGLSEGGDSTLGELVSGIWLNMNSLKLDVIKQE